MMHDYDYEMAQAAHDMQARLETDITTLVDERDEARKLARKLYKRTMFLEAANEASLDTCGRLMGALRYAMKKHGQLAACLDEETDRKLRAQDLAGRLLKFAGRLIVERDEARAQLANAAASEVEAVQRAQECERELREVRRELAAIRAALNGYEDSDLAALADVLVSQRRFLARAVAVLATAEGVDTYEMGQGKVIKLAESILEEGAA